MAAMKREKQFDMFDVATGACTLDDYLFQRYSENDLSSSFWIDKKDEVDELRPPKPLADGRPGSVPEVIPIQGPRAEAAKRAAGMVSEGPPELPIGLELEPSSRGEPAPLPVNAPSVADGSESLSSGHGPISGPSLESFKSGLSASQSQESFQTREMTKLSALDGSDAVRLSNEVTAPVEPVGGQPGVPSMEDLLARFHQAAKEYNERIQPEDSESSEPDSESDSPAEGS